MRYRALAFIALAAVNVIGCRETTAPKTDTVTIIKHDTTEVFPKWNGKAQVVIQATNVNMFTVVALRPDAFHTLSFGDFGVTSTYIHDQKNATDSLYLGQYYWLDASGGKPITWSLSGSMDPSNNTPIKLGTGDVNSFYMLSGYDLKDAYFEKFGSHKVAKIGGEFQLSSKFDVAPEFGWLDNIYYKATVCTDYGVRTFDARTMTETTGDSLNPRNRKLNSSTIKVTCNPILPANASRAAVPPPVKIADFIRAGRKLE